MPSALPPLRGIDQGIDGAAGSCCLEAMINTPRAIDPNTAAHERVFRALRQQVMHGELAPGQAR